VLRSLSAVLTPLAALPLALPGLHIGISITPPTYPVQSAFSAPGPYATTTGEVTEGGTTLYDVFRPSDYAALGFASPIVTWGNGTGAVPTMYTTLLSHFASYGFTVIATTLENTGSGREMDAAAHYLVNEDSTTGSVFDGHLNVHEVASVGHSQGATGAVRVATMDPSLITSLMTFSLPNSIWSAPNPDCPVKADCEKNTALLTQPSFFISTYGPLDSFIASPATERAYFRSVHGHAASGIIATSEGSYADHSSVQDADVGGNPGNELGYATAWLEDTLMHNAFAATAFSGPHPEIVSNINWPGSLVK
jgi:pimeloyl-ACP methyl ester carboxylesterase